MNDADEESSLGQKLEWERARQILEKGDEQILDLRKAGFSFVTALITASAYFGGKDTPAAPDASYVGPLVAMAAMAAIVALFVCDEEIAARQKATAARASIIERFSSVELTDFLRGRAQAEWWDRFRRFVYMGFVAVAFVIGAAGPGMLLLEGYGKPSTTATPATSVPDGATGARALALPRGSVGSADGVTLKVECSAPPLGSPEPPTRAIIVPVVCLAAVFLVGVFAAVSIWVGKFRLSNLRETRLRPGMTDWTLNRWVYDFVEPVFLQIANQSTHDDYLPYLEEKNRVLARLRPIATGDAQPLTCTTWSEPLTPKPLPWFSARRKQPNLPEVCEPNPKEPPEPWRIGYRARCAMSRDPRPHWMLRAQTTLCLAIELKWGTAPGWYEVITANGEVLKRRLRVKQPPNRIRYVEPVRAS